jgi:hypothetical protein
LQHTEAATQVWQKYFLTRIIKTLIYASGTNMKEEVIKKISGFLCRAIDERSDFSEKR